MRREPRDQTLSHLFFIQPLARGRAKLSMQGLLKSIEEDTGGPRTMIGVRAAFLPRNIGRKESSSVQ